jgi:hypothetical protein
VTLPALAPGMEQTHHLARPRINARQVRPVVLVAVVAGQGEITQAVCAAVLPGDNVFDVKREKGSWSWRRRQYSHRFLARLRTNRRVSASITGSRDA